MWSLFGSKNSSTPRVRFAPSPTGFVHVGSLRTALYNYLYARQHGGTFVLRVEDTDQSRLVPGAVENLLRSLAWADLLPDEGVTLVGGKPGEVGDYGPYTQSQRLSIYQSHAAQLVADGHAYHCFCTSERLTSLREDQQAQKLPTRYDGRCRSLSVAEVTQRREAGEPSVIRMRVPEQETIAFEDAIRGPVSFNTADIDDQVLLKSDGFPTYHLANVVDDHMMAITHVIRAEEWLPSTPKHLLLYRSFGWEPPVFAHLPLLLNPDKSKLSKRQGDVAVEDYRDKGYLSRAMVNFVALLGWHPAGDEEILSRDELIQQFDLSRVHKAGAVFDVAKLDWMNGEYIKQLPLEELIELSRPILREKYGEQVDAMDIAQLIALEQPRVARLTEMGDGVSFAFIDQLEYDAQNLIWKKSDQLTTRERLGQLRAHIEQYHGPWQAPELEQSILAWIADQGWTNGEVLWPMRWALTGLDRSPTPFEVAAVLGRERTLDRLRVAHDRLA